MKRYARVTCHSALVEPGSLFAAIPGTSRNGGDFIPDALARGAHALLVPEGAKLPPLPAGIEVIASRDIRTDYALLAAESYGNPARKMRIFGVTGTNGKTTTAWLAAELLKASGETVGLLTTVENSWPGHCEESERTTASAEQLHGAFAAMLAAGCTAAVMEVSSHAADQRRVAGIPFEALGFTNLTQDHLDYHGTMEAYFEAKRRLFLEQPSARAAVNADDPFGRILAGELPLAEPYSLADAAPLELTADGVDFRLSGEPFHSPLPGRYNLSNLLCALTLTRPNLAPGRLREVLAMLRPRWGRLERIEAHTPAALFVDYAHTPDALEKVLAALRELRPKRLICLFGCGGNRDKTKRPRMAEAVAKGADEAIVTSDNPRFEPPEAIIADILPGFPPGFPIHIQPDRRLAIRLALRLGQSGDIILLAGKGHETYQEIDGVKHPFDDRALARTLLPA